MPEVLVAGVDGGASKTRAAIVTAHGAVLGSATVQSASAYHREPDEAAGIVVAAVRQALAAAGRTGPLAALGAGLAGADDPAIHARLVAALTQAGLAAVVHVDHDGAAALVGGLALAPGIVIIAGTGSVAFGVDEAGRRARAGGWGPLLDDEGSGYAIGRATLRAAMRAHDGRGPATSLAGAVSRHFGIESLALLKRAVRGISIDQVAAVAPLAFDAARAGDAEARRILDAAARGLASMVAAVDRALGWTDVPFALVTTGGIFEAGDLILAPMGRELSALGCRAEHRPARYPPEIGAALLAARAAGMSVDALRQGLDRQ
ncbi:MAG: BadF/BadG/BcrA/BcrD ATPase family protein [Armatimonadota bacterium]|nr:BadF/BadG/BcrA/BcrD ATPase family protein [Armatimonadota bacterium]